MSSSNEESASNYKKQSLLGKRKLTANSIELLRHKTDTTTTTTTTTATTKRQRVNIQRNSEEKSWLDKSGI